VRGGILTPVGDFDALVLAGGTAQRLGGADKPALEVGGRAMLDRVLTAASESGADRLVVVGPRRPTAYAVTWCREEPPGGGPVAAIAAALPHLSAPHVTVLAADLPFVDAGTVGRLVRAATGHDGAMLVDPTGRDQMLCAVYAREALSGAIAGQPPAGVPLRRIIARLDVVRLPDDAGASFDCDTWDDLARARGEAGKEEGGRAR